MQKMGQCLARATMLHCIQTTMDKHFLTAFSQDPGCTLRGTVHLLKATPEPKQKEKKKKIDPILHCWKQLHLLLQFYFEQHNASNKKGHNKKC